MTSEEYLQQIKPLGDRLYRTALLYLGSESQARDAVDEALYHGWLKRRQLRNPEYFSTWLTRILINQCNMQLRRRKREAPLSQAPERTAEDFDALPLRDAVAALDPPLRQVIVLRYFEDRTLAETAAILGIPQGTAATRQRRALQLLRLNLSDDED